MKRPERETVRRAARPKTFCARAWKAATAMTCVALIGGASQALAQSCSPFGDPPATLVSPQVTPTCPDGGQLLGPWSDSDGTSRSACLWTPTAASASAPLPLIVFLHASLATADTVAVAPPAFAAGFPNFHTDLLNFLNTANVSDDSSRPGFILLAVEGRDTTHIGYADGDATGTGWDNWYRQLSPCGDIKAFGKTYKENADAATIDHFIKQRVASGEVDTNRIYLAGWSNGSAMAYLYALNRRDIAAIAVYSAPDPFRFSVDPCQQLPVTTKPRNIAEIRLSNPNVPTYQVHNACDVSEICPNTERLQQTLLGLGVSVQDQIIGSGDVNGQVDPTNQNADNGCVLDAVCGSDPNGPNGPTADDFVFPGVVNHLRWPTFWTPAILDFFRVHPLSSRPPEAPALRNLQDHCGPGQILPPNSD